MISVALAKRYHQSAVVSHMVLEIFTLIHRGGYPHKHVGATFEELLVGMAIREHDDFGGKLMTISDIAKRLNIPRSNVTRAIAQLIHRGVIERHGHGCRGRLDYLEARIEADYFKGIVKAVLYAADELRK